jgi:hypothetical protein
MAKTPGLIDNMFFRDVPCPFMVFVFFIILLRISAFETDDGKFLRCLTGFGVKMNCP